MPYTIPPSPADQDEFTHFGRTWRYYSAYSGWLRIDAGVPTGPVVPEPSFVFDEIKLFGGGTHNALAFSPDGSIMAGFSDVGGSRYRNTGDAYWNYLPTRGNNPSRQVAGGCVTNDKIVFQVVGNFGGAGELQEIDIATGQITRLASGLHILANDFSNGDTGVRPRPVGWYVIYDDVNDLIYYCSEIGVGRYNRATSTHNGIIALSGQSCRGFGHSYHMVQSDPQEILVATKDVGLQRINNPSTTATTTRVSPAAYDRVEDVAIIDAAVGSALVTAHTDGVFRYNGPGSSPQWENITPSQSDGMGQNGQAIRWITSAVFDVSGTKMAALGMINPNVADEWLYRALDIETATANDWDNATPTQATMTVGSVYNQPASRQYGAFGNSGPNLIGTYAVTPDPNDATGNTFISSANLSFYKTENFAGSAANITWRSDNDGISMLVVAGLHIDRESNVLVTTADHNSFGIKGIDLTTDEPTRIEFSGTSDGWSVTSVGIGADKVTVFCPAEFKDVDDSAHDVVFHRGTGVPNNWFTTGYNADLNGAGSLPANARPRAGGVFGWDNSNGTYSFVVWADDVGFVRNTYTLSSNSWGTWQEMNSGPTGNLRSDNQHQERKITGSSDGSVVFGIQLKTGQLWRSTNQGANWTAIANSVGTSQKPTAGRLAYLESQDILVASDSNGLYRINNATTTANVTKITGINLSCQIAFDSQDRLFVHVNGSGIVDFFHFDDIATATSTADGVLIDAIKYRSRVGEMASNMVINDINGTECGITSYQGAGVTVWHVPA